MGFHQDATEQFEHIIDKENPHIELYVGLAEAYQRQGDYQRAIENYNSILTRYPENMRALFGAANNWEALGNYTDAIKLYNRVLDVDRSSPRANQKIQALLEKSGQYAEAIEAYQRTKNSQDPQKTQEILASLYYRQAVRQIKAGDLKTAERTLKESRREYDFYVPNMLILANLYLNTGREREAERLLEITAEHSLSTIIFRRLEEYYYSQDGEPAEKFEPVIDLYKKMIETHDANHLRLALGKLYLKLEKYDEAEQMFLQFQSKDSSIPQVHLLLADLYHQIGNIDKALEEYRFSAELVDIKIADFKCYHCNAMYEYWADQCSSCKSWGTIEDIFYTKGPQSVLPELKQRPLPQLSTSRPEDEQEKVVSAS
jgi:tetratricopeptide (TPR) repeat protein